ncbi:MAG: basic amino acid ABC transporter substrate-binding protein [Firmicutes bacterium]|nr:basic amino acid ABC transporter substrate-binding protein [Bacillota bacterium]
MVRRFKWVVFALVVLFVAALAVGCGGQAPKDAGKKEGAQPQQQAPKQKIIVGSDTTFAPLEFQDQKTGKYVGFDVDLIYEIAKVENLEVDFRSMPFDGLIAGLVANQIDVAISSMSITEKRKESIDFSEPYYKSGLCVAVQSKNEKIKGLDDLKGKTIAAQSGTTGETEAKKIEGAKVRSFTNSDQTFMELKNGGVEAVINDYPVTQYFIKQGNSDVKIVGGRFDSEDYGIAVPKGKTELLNKINHGLRELKKNGKFKEFYMKWFGEEPPKELLQ